MLRCSVPNRVVQAANVGSFAQPSGSAGGELMKLGMFRYPSMRLWMSPDVVPPDIEPLDARSAPKLANDRKVAKYADPAAESNTENGVPDWKMVTPLIDQFPSKAPFAPVAPFMKGKS